MASPAFANTWGLTGGMILGLIAMFVFPVIGAIVGGVYAKRLKIPGIAAVLLGAVLGFLLSLLLIPLLK